MARYRLFISAVSSEFERARDQLAASLRAREMDIAVQSDFRQHDDTTLLVTGDADLLTLDMFRGIPIITPSAFIHAWAR